MPGFAAAHMTALAVAEEGHDLGAHGRNHRHLAPLDEAALRSEIGGVAEDLAQLGIALPILLFRAPFDEPYLAHYQRTVLGWEVDDRGHDRIAPIVGERMVHVGWNIDSDDGRCPSDRWAGATCAFETTSTPTATGW